MAIQEYIRVANSPTIHEIIEYLGDQLSSRNLIQSQNTPARRLLVFAILGWQSMLYRPAFNTCPLSELAIHQEIDQPTSRLVFDTFKLPTSLSDRPMSILLKGYGNLLPARSRESVKVASEASRAAATWNPLSPPEVNANLLHALLKIETR